MADGQAAKIEEMLTARTEALGSAVRGGVRCGMIPARALVRADRCLCATGYGFKLMVS